MWADNTIIFVLINTILLRHFNTLLFFRLYITTSKHNSNHGSKSNYTNEKGVIVDFLALYISPYIAIKWMDACCMCVCVLSKWKSIFWLMIDAKVSIFLAYHQHRLHLSCLAIQLLLDFGLVIALLCPILLLWWCHRHPCRTVRKPLWIQQFVLLLIGQPGVKKNKINWLVFKYE